MFRTPTGQTGKDAYVFEATAIANAQRVLDARFTELLKTAHAENPQLFKHSTDYHPRFHGNADSAEAFAEYIA